MANDNDNSDARLSLTEHTLRGEVNRVVYENEETGYAVLRLIDGQGVEHTAVGVVPGAYEGQDVELKGGWERHKEHGRQFRVTSHRFTLPSTKDGIKRYLASGLVKGIGPKIAECIVNHFGERTLEIMDRYSVRLLEVPGFGKKRLEMVRGAWREHEEKRDIFIFLQGLGISPAYCQRIYRLYGDQAPEVVKNNPYQLADDVDGIGFILADRVASSLGIGRNDDKRLVAGTAYSLRQLTLKGHVCYPETKFIELTAELLDLDEDRARRGLALALERQSAVAVSSSTNSNRDRMIYPAALCAAEKELAARIHELSATPNAKMGAVGRLRPSPGVNFNAEQLVAIDNVKARPISVITGGPGVGKTTVIGEIVSRCEKAGLKVYLAAPTGRAAKRLSESCRRRAMTIHRMLKWEPESRAFAYGYRRPLPCDLLIVDEVSMLDLPLALALFRATRPGSSVLLVGDADQLPSVGPGTVLNDLIKSGKCAVTKLTQIYRQGEGSRIIANAHLINAGSLPDLRPVPKNKVTDFYWIEREEPDEVTDMIERMVSERIPKRFGFNPMRDIQVLTPMNRGGCGTHALNESLQRVLNAGNKPQFKIGERVFKAGDRVMQTKNNYDKNVFNGDMGRIARINANDKTFKVNFDGKSVEYEFSDCDELTLSYAVTVHKSQGSEFPVVIVPVLTQHYVMLQRNLIYTAVTRAKKLLVMIGNGKALAIAVRNYQIEPRYSLLLQRLKARVP